MAGLAACASRNAAPGLRWPSRARSAASAFASSTRSVLVTTMRSATATCFTASTWLVERRCAIDGVDQRDHAVQPVGLDSSGCAMIDCSTGAGSASPVVSMTRARRQLRCARSAGDRQIGKRVDEVAAHRAAEAPVGELDNAVGRCSTSNGRSRHPPNSLMMTAVSASAGSLSSRLSSVVLPAPRKPVSTETGMGNSRQRAQNADLVPSSPAGRDRLGDRRTLVGAWRRDRHVRRIRPSPPPPSLASRNRGAKASGSCRWRRRARPPRASGDRSSRRQGDLRQPLALGIAGSALGAAGRPAADFLAHVGTASRPSP